MAESQTLAEDGGHGIQASSATSRVFAIPELVENILTTMAPREILATARVSRAFNDAIKCSNLQRRIGFEHSGKATKLDRFAFARSRDWDASISRGEAEENKSYELGGWAFTIEICPSIDVLVQNRPLIEGDWWSPDEDEGRPYDRSDFTAFTTGSFRFQPYGQEGCNGPVFTSDTCFQIDPSEGFAFDVLRGSVDECMIRGERAIDTEKSWNKMKLLNKAEPITVYASVDTRGTLFGKQKDRSKPWNLQRQLVEHTFSANEATIGNLFAFLHEVEVECQRVNSGIYSVTERHLHRKLLGVEEKEDDRDWWY